MEEQLMQATRYHLIGSAEAFTKAIERLRRLTQERGPEGLLRYSFYVNAENHSACAVIIYRDSRSWLEQRAFVTSLEEYQDFYKTVRLSGTEFYGHLSPDVRQWLAEHDVAFEYAGPLAAGFER